MASTLHRGIDLLGRGLDISTQGAQHHLPEIIRGAGIALRGGASAFRKSLATDTVKQFLARYTVTTLVCYGIAAALGFTILAPIFGLLLFLAPGVIAQLLLSIPQWAYDLTSDAFPHINRHLFLTELTDLDAEYARGIGAAIRAQPVRRSFSERVALRLRSRWRRFAGRSLAVTAIGFIPVIGPLFSTLGHWLAVSEELVWSLLETWGHSRGWNADQRSAFVTSHKWVIVGFGLPFALVGAIPFVGSFAMAVAEGAVAHLVYLELAPPSGERGEAAKASLASIDRAAEGVDRLATQGVSTAVAMGSRLLTAANEAAAHLRQRHGAAAGDSGSGLGGSEATANPLSAPAGGEAVSAGPVIQPTAPPPSPASSPLLVDTVATSKTSQPVAEWDKSPKVVSSAKRAGLSPRGLATRSPRMTPRSRLAADGGGSVN